MSEKMITPTPRTDEFYYERNRRPSDGAWLKYARILERDLAAAQEALASVKAERDAFENAQLPCNVVVNSTVINKGCRVKTALTAIRQQIKYAQPDVAPDRAAHSKDAP